jgi:Nuclease-related domain
MLLWAIILESAFLVAVGAAVLGLIHWKNRKKRLPFTQKILRPPGESLRIRLIELDEKLNDRLIQLFLSAYSPLVMAGLVALQGVRPGAGVWITVAGIAAIASVWSAYRLWKVINLRRRIRLGFEGERHVGEALNQLMLLGYRIFHDFLITDKPGTTRNIDHIVIGRNGVFAVETKARRKVKADNGAKVTVSQNTLQYPWGTDQRDLAQAQDGATWLAGWLSKMSDRSVDVAPILVLPGWFIDRRSKLSVTVLSGSEVPVHVPKLNGTALTDADIRRLAAIIEDRNRSVEY